MDDDFIDSWIEKERQEGIKAKAAANVQRQEERRNRRGRAARGEWGLLIFLGLIVFFFGLAMAIGGILKVADSSPSPSPTAMKSEGKYLPKIFETFEV